MRKAASMFIFLVLGTACIVDLEPAEPDIESSATQPAPEPAPEPAIEPQVEPEVEVSLAGDRDADLDRACPGCRF